LACRRSKDHDLETVTLPRIDLMSSIEANQRAAATPSPRTSRDIGRASVFNTYVLKRLLQRNRVRKVVEERLTEPLHMNLLSLFVVLFGSFPAKVDFDLIVRQQYAFPILHAADMARAAGFRRVTLVEFGVASGAGLLNMCKIARSVTDAVGVEFDVVGFDTGKGMPAATDFRDHPEGFREGDFPMDQEPLLAALPSFARLILGDIDETIPGFLDDLSAESPLAFVAVDVDYYSSAKKALEVLKSDPNKYLPTVMVYLDDIGIESANPWCGELLAVREFNSDNSMRKIAPFTMLRVHRLFKNAQWIEQMYVAHILDHPRRSPAHSRPAPAVIANEYIG
jgi:hypothetical protein